MRIVESDISLLIIQHDMTLDRAPEERERIYVDGTTWPNFYYLYFTFGVLQNFLPKAFCIFSFQGFLKPFIFLIIIFHEAFSNFMSILLFWLSTYPWMLTPFFLLLDSGIPTYQAALYLMIAFAVIPTVIFKLVFFATYTNLICYFICIIQWINLHVESGLN